MGPSRVLGAVTEPLALAVVPRAPFSLLRHIELRVRRWLADPGVIAPPCVRVIEYLDGRPGRVVVVRGPLPQPRLRALGRLISRRSASVALNAAGEPELRVLHDGARARLVFADQVRGELRVGVARVGLDELARDPSLRADQAATTSYALPMGSTAVVRSGKRSWRLDCGRDCEI